MNKYEDIEEEVLKRETKKEKKSKMRVSGRSVLNLLKIISKKAKKK